MTIDKMSPPPPQPQPVPIIESSLSYDAKSFLPKNKRDIQQHRGAEEYNVVPNHQMDLVGK